MQFNVCNFLSRSGYETKYDKYVFYDEKRIVQYYLFNYYCSYWYYRIEHWEIKNNVVYFHVIPNNKGRIKDNKDWVWYLFNRTVFEKIVDSENSYGLSEIKHLVRNSQHIFSNIKI